MRHPLVRLPALVLALACAPAAFALQHSASVASAAPGGAEIFRGGLVNTMSARGHGAKNFELRLDGYTTDDEMARLADLESRKGPQALSDELYKHRLGFIRVDQSLGYPVSIARRVSGPNGDTIYAVMDRPLQLWEVWNASPSRDYPFSVVEIQVGRDGKLSGNLYPLAMVDLLGRGSLHIANDLPMPFRLIGLDRTIDRHGR